MYEICRIHVHRNFIIIIIIGWLRRVMTNDDVVTSMLSVSDDNVWSDLHVYST